jgi:two-component system, LytTR family, sensor kinase
MRLRLVQEPVGQWLRAGWRRLSAYPWVRRVVLWSGCYMVIRYIYYENLFEATDPVQTTLAVVLQVQTMLSYYLLGYVFFPRTLYKGRIGWFLVGVAGWHALMYVSNYALFHELAQTGEGGRVARTWQLLQTWGVWGFLSSLAANFWSFVWTNVFVSVLLTVRAVTDIVTLREQVLTLEKDKLQIELDFLKAQVNPHFLFNTLNSIYARVFDTDEGAADLLLRLSELMRYNLYETNQPYVALPSELSYIQNYLNLEQGRLGDQRVDIRFTQSGDATPYQIAPLLLIALVENAFKHGVKGLKTGAFVHVSAHVMDRQLVFAVENSVPPRRVAPTTDPVRRTGGVGLVNVRRRLLALYTDRHTVTITPGDTVYRAEIAIGL